MENDKKIFSVVVDMETVGGYRVIRKFPVSAATLSDAIKSLQRSYPSGSKGVVQFIDVETGETIKGPKYDTTTQKVKGENIKQFLGNVKQQNPSEPSQNEPRDRFQENKNMNELSKFRNVIRECISEIKKENDPRERLKESLRGMVKNVLKEVSTFTTSGKPEQTKEEKENSDKQFFKDMNPRLDKTNDKQKKEIETIVHGIDPNYEVDWDDHNQLIVNAQNLLYVRICQRFEDSYDIDAMVKLVDRVRAIAQTWEQVKTFIKANFSDLKKTTNADRLTKKSLDNYKDKEVIKKSAGPDNFIVKNRGEKNNGEDAKIKNTKKSDMDYNEPQTKKDEDMPDQPMKQVTEPGKDPEGKNKNIKKTDKVAPPKHKNDKKLVVSPKKTPKFTKKQVS